MCPLVPPSRWPRTPLLQLVTTIYKIEGLVDRLRDAIGAGVDPAPVGWLLLAVASQV